MGSIKLEESIAKRIQKAMDIRGMKQVDLVEKTGISKGSIHQYVTGYVEPKSDRIHLIANALDVNPVWLIGVDVPMESSATYNKKSADLLMDSYEDKPTRQVIEIMNQLDDKGKEQVLQYATFILTQNQKA